MAADTGHATEEMQLAGARQDSKSKWVLAINGEHNVGVMAASDFEEVVMTVGKGVTDCVVMVAMEVSRGGTKVVVVMVVGEGVTKGVVAMAVI